VGPNRIDNVVGVMKAYTTRVGEGPMPTQNAEISDLLHGMGREFGATTGRARRCGWFDAVLTRYATIVNGIDELAVTNVDGLDTVDVIKVCIGYRVGKQRYDYVPSDVEVLSKVEPIYAEFAGWKTSTEKAKTWKDLPKNAQIYLKAIAELTGAKLKIVSVGPAREQTMIL
jgi:adenylosuccinate synthase